jgi:hypothetical protein
MKGLKKMKDDFNFRKLLDSVDYLKNSVVKINSHIGLESLNQLNTEKSVNTDTSSSSIEESNY